MGFENKLIRVIRQKARQERMRIVFAESNNFKMLKAAIEVLNENIAQPVLLGNRDVIMETVNKYNLDISGMEIIDVRSKHERGRRKRYGKIYWEKRQRKGLTETEAFERMFERNHFGIMMVETGEADGFISGISSKYREITGPAIRLIGKRDDIETIAGMYMIMTKKGPYFISDTTVNLDPSPQTLASNAILTAEKVREFNVEPVVAMLSYSNFGSIKEAKGAKRVREAVRILHDTKPELLVDGEIQANFALNTELRDNLFPFSK